MHSIVNDQALLAHDFLKLEINVKFRDFGKTEYEKTKWYAFAHQNMTWRQATEGIVGRIMNLKNFVIPSTMDTALISIESNERRSDYNEYYKRFLIEVRDNISAESKRNRLENAGYVYSKRSPPDFVKTFNSLRNKEICESERFSAIYDSILPDLNTKAPFSEIVAMVCDSCTPRDLVKIDIELINNAMLDFKQKSLLKDSRFPAITDELKNDQNYRRFDLGKKNGPRASF